MLGEKRWRKWPGCIERLHERIAGLFRRPEPRRQVPDYLHSLLSSVELEPKTGWQRPGQMVAVGIRLSQRGEAAPAVEFRGLMV